MKKLLSHPRFHLLAYVLIILITPLVLLQGNYRIMIDKISLHSFNIGNLQIHTLLIVLILMAIIVLLYYRKNLSKNRIIGLLLCFVFLEIGHIIPDFYYGNTIYDLYSNSQILGYSLFAWFYYRLLKYHRKSDAFIIITGFLIALLVSAFGKFLQTTVLSRLLDVSEIGKNIWGIFIGYFFIYFVYEDAKNLRKSQIIPPKFIQVYSNPSSALLHIGFFSLVFLIFASFLKWPVFINYAVGIPLLIYIVLIFITRALRIKFFRIIVISLFMIIIIVQGFFTIKYWDDNFVYYRENIAVYCGIPIIGFDFVVYPCGLFRPVEKKLEFAASDRDRLAKIGADIILIASGYQSRGAAGYVTPGTNKSDLRYNKYTGDLMHIMVYNTPLALEKYNELKAQGKDILLVVNNSK